MKSASKTASEIAGNCQSAGVPFDKNTSVADIMVRWPQTVPVFLRYQMFCVGCYVGPFHTITDACLEHDIEEPKLLQDLAIAVAVG